MKKGTIIEIDYIIYPYKLLVAALPYKDLREELKKTLPVKCHRDIKEFDDDYNALTVMFENGLTCINFKQIGPGTIAHEAFHAVQFLMESINMPLTSDSCEAWAYLIGYIVNKITETI